MSNPTGQVKLLVDGTEVFSSNLSQGQANLVWTPTAAGTYSLTVQYLGDGTHNPSTSDPITLEVDSGVVDTTVSFTVSPNPDVVDQHVTAVATVSNA